MRSFFLDIQLPNGSTLNELLLDGMDRCAVLTTEALVLTPADRGDDHVRYAAIFVPSTLVDTSFASPTSSRLLHLVHPYLGQNFNLSATILLRNPHHAPSDLLLIDLSHSPPSEIEHLWFEMTGQILHSGPDAVLKLLPIANVRPLSSHEAAPSIPHCAVCLHRIEPQCLGLPSLPSHARCSRSCETQHCRLQRLLQPWPRPSHCVVCDTLQHYRKHSRLQCQECDLSETLWVCMTCGLVGCGRYSNQHSVHHYDQSQHPFSLELATCRIWDYERSEFVHRQDVLECPSRPSLPQEPSTATGDNTKKTTVVGQEYEVLLMSALEDQAQHYEGKINRLRTELLYVEPPSADEALAIADLRADMASLEAKLGNVASKLLQVQSEEARHRGVSQKLLREQQAAQDVLQEIRDKTRTESQQGQAELEDLQAQIVDLTANQNMRAQFSSGELVNAQIFGTTTTTESPPRGKGKLRRMFRK